MMILMFGKKTNCPCTTSRTKYKVYPVGHITVPRTKKQKNLTAELNQEKKNWAGDLVRPTLTDTCSSRFVGTENQRPWGLGAQTYWRYSYMTLLSSHQSTSRQRPSTLSRWWQLIACLLINFSYITQLRLTKKKYVAENSTSTCYCKFLHTHRWR